MGFPQAFKEDALSTIEKKSFVKKAILIYD